MEKKYFGARVHSNGECSFRIFAPDAKRVEISIKKKEVVRLEMISSGTGFHDLIVPEIESGTAYSFTVDDFIDVPDPASLFQPEGSKSSSVVVNHHSFDWRGDSFPGLPMSEMLIYEVHVGAFSPQKTFSGILERLDYLCELGINTLQLMPVSQFSGSRSWGYDTVFPYAVHNSYGTPEEFKELVRQCHLREVAVIVDVNFAALTPVNELTAFYPPFLSKKYNLEQGRAVNFDDRFSIGIREFYIQCALSWLRDYHVDGLRISDAHSIIDQTPLHFIEELSLRVKDFASENSRHCVLITGDKRNSLRPVLSFDEGGYGADALYNDDFRNSLVCRLTGDRSGRLNDYKDPERIVCALQYGFAYRGELSSHYMRLQGRSRSEIIGSELVVYSQGHSLEPDGGDGCRIIEKAGFEAAKLSAGVTILSPYIPLIFMGEEYGESSPFHFFNDACECAAEKQTGAASPSDESIYSDCCLNWQNIESDKGQAMLSLYRRLLEIRKEHPAVSEPCRGRCQVQEISPGIILLLRNCSSSVRDYAAVLFNFNREETDCDLYRFLPDGVWVRDIYSASRVFGGTAEPLPRILPANESIVMAPQSFAIFFYSEIDTFI